MKGQYGGSCNITACQKENSAFWFNHFNQMYYCEECANRLNNDIFNKRSALEKLGHDMCTLEVERGITFKIKNPLEILCDNIIRDASIKLTDYGEKHQSGRESRRARRKQERKNKKL